ncbi:MAG: transporter [Alphaproteobacteria bacterium]|nr:transporter [Alphaproteobacteria bacterium]
MANGLFEKGAITGIGETAYTRGSGKSDIALQMEASLKAIADAGLKPSDIDGVVPYAAGAAVAEDFITNFNLPDLRFSATTPLGGASCVAAIQAAVTAVAAGLANHVLIPIGRNGYSGGRIGDRVQQMPQFRTIGEFEMPLGTLAPAQLYSHMARRHMEMYGTKSEHFAKIAMAVRKHAAMNDNALRQGVMTLEDHQNSRIIADPLRLFDCCLESDGGAAVIVSASERAKDMASKPAYIMGVAEGHPDSPSTITQRPDITTLGTAKAAPRAFEMAGITHKDIDVAEIYDCFTYIVLCQMEDLGFCKKGEGGDFVASTNFNFDGDLPLNTHGGLLSQAHIVGMNHVVELVKQLRGTAGAAQVKDAEIGLVTGYGDLGDGTVAIMRA